MSFDWLNGSNVLWLHGPCGVHTTIPVLVQYISNSCNHVSTICVTFQATLSFRAALCTTNMARVLPRNACFLFN